MSTELLLEPVSGQTHGIDGWSSGNREPGPRPLRRTPRGCPAWRLPRRAPAQEAGLTRAHLKASANEEKLLEGDTFHFLSLF